MNQLEQWCDLGLIELEWSLTAYTEAVHDSDNRAKKADRYHWVEAMHCFGFERSLRDQIAETLFPSGVVSDSQRNDVEIVFNAKVAGATLITEDGNSRTQPGGLLGNREALKRIGIQVCSTEDAVAEVVRGLSGSCTEHVDYSWR